jgi:mono/diheme cytochrome c family protein
MFAIIVALATFSPVPLDDKADPNNVTFVAYPAWYFLALYALLDAVGKLPDSIVQIASLFATIVGPTLLIVLLIVLPFIDRNPSRRLTRRPWVLGITALVMLGANAVAAAANAPAPLTVEGGPQGTAGSTGSSGGVPTAGSAGAGAQVFSTSCSGCHGASGQGVPSTFPPLANNPVVTGDPGKVIGIVLNGLNGSVTVNGGTYNGQMPAWKGQLTNAQVASVITYIRSAWGNKASAVTEAQVAAAAK